MRTLWVQCSQEQESFESSLEGRGRSEEAQRLTEHLRHEQKGKDSGNMSDTLGWW